MIQFALRTLLVFGVGLAAAATARADKRETSVTIIDPGGYYVDPHEDLQVTGGGEGRPHVRLESDHYRYLLRCPSGRVIRILRVDGRAVHVNCIDVSDQPVS